MPLVILYLEEDVQRDADSSLFEHDYHTLTALKVQTANFFCYHGAPANLKVYTLDPTGHEPEEWLAEAARLEAGLTLLQIGQNPHHGVSMLMCSPQRHLHLQPQR
jgi:hypothetical protein